MSVFYEQINDEMMMMMNITGTVQQNEVSCSPS